MAGRTSQPSRRRATTPTRAAATSRTRATPASRRRATPARPRRGANIPGPLDVLGRVIVGVWMGLAHGVGWSVRAMGRQAATARELESEHRRDGRALLAVGMALLLIVATW